MYVAGYDEVGRGAWAGPLLVVGVVLGPTQFKGLKDSKALSKGKRELLYKQIVREAPKVSAIWSSNADIDKHGLAVCLQRSFTACAQLMNQDAQQHVVDGSYDYIRNGSSTALIKGDEKMPAIAAASIVAKHLRDKYMQHLHSIDDRYSFDKNVGYGTKQHIESIEQHGPSTVHRLSFKGVLR